MSRSRPMLPGQHVCFSFVSLVAVACATTPAPTPELQGHEAAPALVESDAAPSSSLVPSHVEFAFVIVGSSAGKPFTTAVPKPGPAVLSKVWVGAWPEVLDETVKRAFGAEAQRWEGSGEEALVELDAVELARRGFEVPSDPLWLIGPEGPCRVRLTTPMLGWYIWGPEVVELSWALALDDSRVGCEMKASTVWAPIAVFADSLPASLRYVAAEQRSSEQVELASWSSPLAQPVGEAVAGSDFAANSRLDELWVREVVVPGTELLELTVAMVERYVPQPGEAPDPCMDQQENLVLAGLTPSGVELWDDAWMELRGAFVVDGEPVWSVHERFGQPVIHTFTDGVDDVQLTIAGFHEEDFGEPRFSKVEYCGP